MKEVYAKIIWLLENTNLTNKAISKLTGIDHSQIGRINDGQLIKDFPLHKDVVYPIRTVPGTRTDLSEDEIIGYSHLLLYEIPKMTASWREENLLFAGVYRITCLKNNRSYVGATQLLRRRLLEHKNGSSNVDLAADIRCYGWDSFRFEVIEPIADSLAVDSYLREREGYYIRKLEPSYNLQPGSRPFLQLDRHFNIVDRHITIQGLASKLGKAVSGNVGRALSGDIISLYGFYWVYEDEYSQDWKPRSDKRLKGYKVYDADSREEVAVLYGREAVADFVEYSVGSIESHMRRQYPETLKGYVVEKI